MKYTAAYLLAVLGGNSSPDIAAIAKILGSVGIECDKDRAQQVVDACKGRDVNEIIANGMTKVDNVLANTSTATTTGSSLPSVVPRPPSPPCPISHESPPPSPTGSETFLGLFD